MRHHVVKHSFGRKQGPRVALIRGLVTSLVAEGRIKTTLTKAKELRRHVERAITMGKSGGDHAKRILLSRFPNQSTVTALVDDLGKRFAKRPGGYTRIVKLGKRAGDCSEMAYIEFVDFEPKAAKSGEEKVVAGKEAAKKAKVAARANVKRKKTLRKIQAASRRRNRAN